jgi:hypothetical protein
MPTNRTTIARRRRNRFSPETVALFERLEREPNSRRDTEKFKASVKALHIALGEDAEMFWLMGLHVTDRPLTPARSDEFYTGVWKRAVAMRKALLAAVAKSNCVISPA